MISWEESDSSAKPGHLIADELRLAIKIEGSDWLFVTVDSGARLIDIQRDLVWAVKAIRERSARGAGLKECRDAILDMRNM